MTITRRRLWFMLLRSAQRSRKSFSDMNPSNARVLFFTNGCFGMLINRVHVDECGTGYADEHDPKGLLLAAACK